MTFNATFEELGLKINFSVRIKVPVDIISTTSQKISDIQKHLITKQATSHPPINGSVMYFTSLGK